jgi:hypothetical protein
MAVLKLASVKSFLNAALVVLAVLFLIIYVTSGVGLFVFGLHLAWTNASLQTSQEKIHCLVGMVLVFFTTGGFLDLVWKYSKLEWG